MRLFQFVAAFAAISATALCSVIHPDGIAVPTANSSLFKAMPSSSGLLAANDMIIETLVFVDKTLADKFNQDMVRILDYLTVYFWDMNMRYKTLPSSRISFRVVSVIKAQTQSDQPFVAKARADNNNILYHFSQWIVENKNSLAKSDLAILMTGEQWGPVKGVAYGKSMCNPATAFITDFGDWESVATAAHEIAHTIGAPHDDDYPQTCQPYGYIMSGATTLRWFFSPCSDKFIHDFVQTSKADCMRRLDGPQNYPITPDFSMILAPNMLEQCKRRFGTGYSIVDSDTGNCEKMKCQMGADIKEGAPVDDSVCLGGGRCFRGRCRQIGKIVQNVASGKCMYPPNPFTSRVFLEMADCPPWPYWSPLDRFTLNTNSLGVSLSTPYNSPSALENGDRCVVTGTAEGYKLFTAQCDPANPWQHYEFVPLGNYEYLMKHKPLQTCAKQIGTEIMLQPCNSADTSMRWKI